MLIPMKDIIRVVTISLMPWRALSQAGMSVQAPPMTIAMSDRITQPTGDRDDRHDPRPEARDERAREEELAVDAEVPEPRAEDDDDAAADDEDRRRSARSCR